MNPSEIRNLIDAAKRLRNEKNYVSPESFVLAWVAWEAFLVRLLIAGLCTQGFSVRSASDYVLNSRHWVRDSYTVIFKEIMGVAPGSTAGFGQYWKTISQAKKIRGAYFHGTYRPKPEWSTPAFDSICELLGQEHPLQTLVITNPRGEKLSLRNPMRRLSRNKNESLNLSVEQYLATKQNAPDPEV